MNKLSRKKRPTGSSKGETQQGKITGFFSKQKELTVVNDASRVVLENVTNMVGKVAEHDEEPILTSPVIIRKEKEVFEKTPEVNTKRKFKLKSRRGAACKTNLEDKTEFKRKLQEEEEMSVNLNDAAMAGNVEEVLIRLNMGEDVNQKCYPR